MATTAASPSKRFMPTTNRGRAAGVSAIIAIAALVLANTFAADAAGVRNVLRISLLLVFNVSGVVALIAGILALRLHDRSIAVWVATGVGLAANLLLIAEFTVME